MGESKQRITLSEFGKTLLMHLKENGVTFKDISTFSEISNSTCDRLLKGYVSVVENRLKINSGNLKEDRFYVYLHKTCNKVFYIGKGTKGRHKSRSGRSKEWYNKVEQFGFISEIVQDGLSEDEAFSLEYELIKKYKKEGCQLVNKTESNQIVKIIDKSIFEGRIKYDESSSTFLRWVCSSRGTKEGDEAGSLNMRNNYHSVTVCGESYLVHRVIATLFDLPLTPQLVVDHIDGNRLNNNISNLRVVSKQVNLRNKEVLNKNTRLKGISLIFIKRKNSWYYRVRWRDTLGKDQERIVKTIEGGRKKDLDEAIKIRNMVYDELKLIGLEL